MDMHIGACSCDHSVKSPYKPLNLPNGCRKRGPSRAVAIALNLTAHPWGGSHETHHRIRHQCPDLHHRCFCANRNSRFLVQRHRMAVRQWWRVCDNARLPQPHAEDPHHPYVPNGTGKQPTFRIGDITNPNLKQWAKDVMKEDNDEVLAGKIADTP